MGFLSWVEANWFQALQSASIAFGLVISGLGFFRGTREHRVANLLKLTECHRTLWGEASKRPELRRVLDVEADLVGRPVSFEEELFVNELIVHLSTAWLLARAGSLLPLRSIRADVRAFFALPIPKAVWKSSRHARDPKFVRFVERCLER
jgi:hypothetical protein